MINITAGIGMASSAALGQSLGQLEIQHASLAMAKHCFSPRRAAVCLSIVPYVFKALCLRGDLCTPMIRKLRARGRVQECCGEVVFSQEAADSVLITVREQSECFSARMQHDAENAWPGGHRGLIL